MAVTTRKIQSRYNGLLEITADGNKKILDGKSVNLSFGSVHKIWKDVLNRCSLPAGRILLLGLGGGSVVELLRKDFHFKGPLTAVELDPVVIRIAAKEFGIRNSPGLTIHEADAFQYLQKAKHRFDLILTDVFIEARVIEAVFEEPFWQDCRRLLKPGGILLLNVSSSGRNLRRCKILMKRYSGDFQFTLLEKMGGSNTFLKAIRL